MIRPFNIRDLALVHRLRERGVSLHTKSALTDSLNPLRGAVFNMLVGGEFPTFVWKAEERDAAGFIQLYLEESSHQARILYLSSMSSSSVDAANLKEGVDSNGSEENVDESVWLPLLDQAVVEAGKRGIHSLVAEVSEVGAELPVLRRAGFAVYTRQDIWVFNEHEKIADKQKAMLTPSQSKDDWEIQLLYANTVPRLVQLVEPMPPLTHDNDGWVLRENGELTAFVHIHEGPAAIWLGLYIHPNAEARADDIIATALQMKPAKDVRPVYCCVRRYQSWVQSALQRTDFVFWGSQAVMVKHTVHYRQKPLPDLAAVLEKQGISATTPMIQQYHRSQGAEPFSEDTLSTN